ncbi:ADP-ribosylation factor-like protein 4A [Drosophila tropicalis]|uniref:ADP-ribosylation factor-like protein 4A n=1 Tax=Drosophila tropicalis TaxID=46794 RepID=UPI0035ABE84B
MGATMVKNGNLLDALPSQVGTLHVVMLGLDSAGKTTALYRLKFDQYLNTVPTIGFNCEKVQGTLGKAKGVHFLVWDVGGQEKLRPLWRSYTRCTDGILFVVDSVDTERMEEAKMELMRTAKCPDNQGVPVLILANKQDLPNACGPKELEKLLGLHELHISHMQSLPLVSSGSTSTGNLMGYNAPNQSYMESEKDPSKNSSQMSPAPDEGGTVSSHSLHSCHDVDGKDKPLHSTQTSTSSSSPPLTTTNSGSHFTVKTHSIIESKSVQLKGWYIQPACAITGEGLQEGLDALYDMILRRRKLNKTHKKKR